MFPLWMQQDSNLRFLPHEWSTPRGYVTRIQVSPTVLLGNLELYLKAIADLSCTNVVKTNIRHSLPMVC